MFEGEKNLFRKKKEKVEPNWEPEPESSEEKKFKKEERKATLEQKIQEFEDILFPNDKQGIITLPPWAEKIGWENLEREYEKTVNEYTEFEKSEKKQKEIPLKQDLKETNFSSN